MPCFDRMISSCISVMLDSMLPAKICQQFRLHPLIRCAGKDDLGRTHFCAVFTSVRYLSVGSIGVRKRLTICTHLPVSANLRVRKPAATVPTLFETNAILSYFSQSTCSAHASAQAQTVLAVSFKLSNGCSGIRLYSSSRTS